MERDVCICPVCIYMCQGWCVFVDRYRYHTRASFNSQKNLTRGFLKIVVYENHDIIRINEKLLTILCRHLKIHVCMRVCVHVYIVHFLCPHKVNCLKVILNRDFCSREKAESMLQIT